MKQVLSSFAVLVLTMATVHSQAQEPLISIEGTDIPVEEFKWSYEKSKPVSGADQLSEEQFLEKYIALKLKVEDAREMGLDQSDEFKRDLEEYDLQLVNNHIHYEVTLNEIMQEAYERMQQDVELSHILVKIPEGQSPADTLKAYERIKKIRSRILAGEDFEKVARETSDDGAIEINGGNLNYQTVFTLGYPMENAAYNTAVGEISGPFRSNNGYHIVKVHDKRDAWGDVLVANIYVAESKEKIYAAYEELRTGKDFLEVARKYSEDDDINHEDGEILGFGVGKMPPNIENQSFGIVEPGDYTRPFESMFGWHIIKLIEKYPVKEYKELEGYIKAKVEKEKRVEYHTAKHVSDVRQKYGSSEFTDALDVIVEQLDDSLLKGQWKGGTLFSDATKLFTIGSWQMDVGDFVQFIIKNQSSERKARESTYYMYELYVQFRQETVLKYEKVMIRQEHPEIAYLLNEYRDGVLLYEIMNIKVWTKALSDEAGLEEYFSTRRENYMWGERCDAFIVNSSEGASIEKVRKKYKKIQNGSLDADALNDKFCDNDTLACIHVARVLTEKGVYERIDKQNGIVGPGPVYSNNDTKGFVIINSVLAPEPKKLDEAKGQVVSDYQMHLEKTWTRELEEKYRVNVNKDLL